MITDEIMQIIYNIRDRLEDLRDKLNHEHEIGNIHTCDYTPKMDIIETKLAIIYEVEEKLGDYEE